MTCPYWPCPPDWRTNFPSAVVFLRIVSRNATLGRPTLASTLNSLTIRSVSISKCSSPIPDITVCPVSSSYWTRKVGSSSDNLTKASDNLSWSALAFGSIATETTGSGNSIFSRSMGFSRSQNVSPVEVSFKPTAAAISPANTSSTSSLWSACILTIRPNLSRSPVTVLRTLEPDLALPE